MAIVLDFERDRLPRVLSHVVELRAKLALDAAQFSALLDTLPVVVLFSLDRQCAEIYGNAAAHVLLRCLPGQNLSRSAAPNELPAFQVYVDGKVVPPDDLPMQKAARTGRPVPRSECEVRFADGGHVFLEGHSVPLFDSAGEVQGSIGAFVDISVLKRLERENRALAARLEQQSFLERHADLLTDPAASLNPADLMRRLAKSEEQLRLAQHAAGAGVWDWNILTGANSWTPEQYRIFGLDPETFGPVSYETWRSKVHPEDVEREEAKIRLALRDRGNYSSEFRIVRPDGTVRWVLARSSVVMNNSGDPVRMIGINLDVTDRHNIEEALLEKHNELKAVLDAVPAAVWISRDISCQTVTGNRAAYHMLRLPATTDNLSKSAPIDERPQNFRVFVGGRELAPEELPLQRAASEGVAVTGFEETIVFDDSSVTHVYGNAVPLFDTAGMPKGAVGAFVDVTPLVEAREAASRAEERLRLAARTAHLGTFEWDIQRNINIWSPELEALYGLQPGTFGGTYEAWAKQLCPDDLAGAEASIQQSLVSGAFHAEWRVVLPDGAIRWLEARGWVFHDQDAKPIRMVGVNFDISERKQAEEHLTLMLAELSHRTKNLLSVVQAVALLSLRGARSAEDYQRRFLDRLQALSRVLSVGLEQQWKSVDFKTAARAVLSPFEGRIKIGGADLELPSAVIQNLGLILHELATNAVKYGALSVETGEVSLTCTSAPGGSYTITWRESGGPKVVRPSREGFGSTLMTRLSDSFGAGARSQIDWLESGVVWTLEVP